MISVLIVNFNGGQVIERCLDSLGLAVAQDDEVIVVDNASTDGSRERIKNLELGIKNFTFLENNENVGFGKANNLAFEKSRGDLILLLNPDTEITKDAIDELVSFASSHQDAGIVVPQLTNADGSVQASCYHLPTIGAAIKEFILGRKDAYSKYVPNVTDPVVVEAAVGAAMLIPRSIIEKLGKLFDEKYFIFYEDIDLCRRTNQMGKHIYYLPNVSVLHHHGFSTGQTGEWAYKQNQKSAKLYFGPTYYGLLTIVLKYGQKWQKLLKILFNDK